ncbi:hypothetical protein OCEANICA350_12739 [Oceanicaulis sp. 350]|nr:hypothetical protein OCEANICA350_12739 [Oceanicaulis sp. 350]
MSSRDPDQFATVGAGSCSAKRCFSLYFQLTLRLSIVCLLHLLLRHQWRTEAKFEQ